MSNYITTNSKIHIDPTNPDPLLINIFDIAHSLSMQCRANGHFSEFYTVAQHSIDCFLEAKARGLSRRVQLACLLHDAAEAYISDVPRSIKKHLEYYQQIERRLLSTIYTKFLGSDLTPDEQRVVEKIDDILLYYEFKKFMNEELGEKLYLITNPTFQVKTPPEIKEMFLNSFNSIIL